MKQNIGSTDRIVRFIVALILIALYMGGALTGTLGIVALVAAGILAVTGFVRFCGLYALMGISTACSASGGSSCGCCCGGEEEKK